MAQDGRLLKLHADDSVAVALVSLEPGDALAPVAEARARDPIPAGHKVAVTAIRSGDAVLRLGQPIGRATRDIRIGEHVHLHNLGCPASLVGRDIAVCPPAPRNATDAPSFQGYRRADGRAATRNYLGVLTTVNCSARVARLIAGHFDSPAALEAYPGIDGVMPLTHASGCSIADGSPSMTMLRRTIAGYARHPNFVGVLVVGLGCEDNQIEDLFETEGLEPGPGLRSLAIQDLGGTRATVQAGIEAAEAMLQAASGLRREPIPVSELVVGLQCGGSDSFSGLTANPALGRAADRLVGHGGTVILSETPEIYGAENLLLERVASREVGDRLVALLEWWEAHTVNEPKGLDNNPSPGNKAGGLTTILEKSLGAVAKGGSTPLTAVYRYAEPVTARGLTFMDSPGFDPVSATGQVAGGANVVCFTTGRGSCFGCRPAPSIKLATNTAMYRQMEEDMDINCGAILDGTATLEEMGAQVFDAIVATASGRPTCSELLGYGDDEFAPWHINAWI